MKYTFKTYSALPDDALSLRMTVFVKEQGFIDEIDERDNASTHIVIYGEEKNAIGTCRIFKSNDKGDFILGRLCVLKEYRGKGIGKALIIFAENVILNQGGKTIHIHSQYQAKDFYQKSGYTMYGEPDYEQNHLHTWLKKEL